MFRQSVAPNARLPAPGDEPSVNENDQGSREYYQKWLRHWRLDNSIIQRGISADNWSRPLAFFPKEVCRVSSRQGASIDPP